MTDRTPAPAPPPGHATGRRVLLAGATGLVGRELLQGLLADPRVALVHALARRPLDMSHARLQVHLVDFRALPQLPPLDEAYLALGTTIKIAGSQPAFRAVDFDANLAVARAALAAGARRLGLVSAMGADARSRVFYSRVKGELEAALAALEPLDALVIARPSMLHGDRARLGQPARPGERWGLRVSQLLGPLIPAHYRAIAARDVARALLARVPVARGREQLLSGDMQPRLKRHQT
ncbi:MAG: NAD(P)H-binding protein [Pseudomonadota bacterium]